MLDRLAAFAVRFPIEEYREITTLSEVATKPDLIDNGSYAGGDMSCSIIVELIPLMACFRQKYADSISASGSLTPSS